MKKTLILDASPVFYRYAFSSVQIAKNQLKIKPDENGIYPLNEFKDIFLYNVLNSIISMKNRFQVDEVILAIDTKPYWRKDIWPGYKHGRKVNDNSGIDWEGLSEITSEISELLKDNSNIKLMKIPGVEGDDILFILSKELSDRGQEVIVKSIDHDIYYCLEYSNVKYWQVKHHVGTKDCGYVEFDKEELKKMKFEHVFFGDPGDYILSVVAFSQFSNKFREIYPDITELQAWPKRFEIDQKFKEKFGESAYKHPRFGAKSYYKKQVKEGFTNEEFLDRNPIYKLNYELNKLISLPEYIPNEIRERVIREYDKEQGSKNPKVLNEYFLSNNLFNLIGKIPQF